MEKCSVIVQIYHFLFEMAAILLVAMETGMSTEKVQYIFYSMNHTLCNC